MICELCKQRESVLHVQQIIGDERVNMYLCEICASEKGISQSDDKLELSISRLLTGLFGSGDGTDERGDQDTCPACETNIVDLRNDGRLGCPECYMSFSSELRGMQKKLSGSVQHVGKLPKKIREYKELMLDKRHLQERLEAAVQNEDYEDAARLRDQIHDIDRNGG